MKLKILNLGGLNTYINPLIKNDGDLLTCINMDSYPYGAKTKRQGYTTFLGTANGSAVTDLFSWEKNNGALNVYRVSGQKLFSSTEGTGAFTQTANGTLSNNKVGYAVLDDTMIMGDGVGSTRHTTDGTSFTDTVLAPKGEFFAQYQNRIYIGGTSSTTFYSTTNDATNWALSGTSDSSSFTVPGAGKMGQIFKANDRLVMTKTSKLIYRYDGYNLVDTSTFLGPSSPYSVAQAEGYFMWLNQKGVFGYGGDKPQLLSNAIERQIYNRSGSAIAGATFGTAPATTHRYDYLLAAGTVTDDFTGQTVKNAIIKYNFQKNEFLNYSFYNNPTALHSFINTDGNEKLIFGASNGQVYELESGNTDNGQPIEATMEFVVHLSSPELDKEFRKFYGFFNPGCNAKVQVALSDTYTRDSKKWIDIGDCVDGICEYQFPQGGNRGKLLFVKIYENSKDPAFTCYGFAVEGDVVND